MKFVTRPVPAHPLIDPPLDTAVDPIGHVNEDLTPQERAVYDVLEANRGRVLSRAELSRRAGIADLSDRRCDSLIVGIRRTVGPDLVVTVRRRGWMLVA